MSDLSPVTPDCGAGPVVVFVDSAFEPMIPKFMTNRNKEIVAMTDAIAQRDFDYVSHLLPGSAEDRLHLIRATLK